MNFFSGLFPVVATVVFMTSFGELESANTCDTTNEITDATTLVMKMCNSKIKDYYNKHQASAASYCEGMKVH